MKTLVIMGADVYKRQDVALCEALFEKAPMSKK